MTPITASMLYDLVACPHRVTMDMYANPADSDDVSPFVQLLWERGFAHEQAVIAALKIPFLDLSGASDLEKEKLTLEAMARGEPLIYSGRIETQDPAIKQRILDYNEDDCRATRVLLDGISAMA